MSDIKPCEDVDIDVRVSTFTSKDYEEMMSVRNIILDKENILCALLKVYNADSDLCTSYHTLPSPDNIFASFLKDTE